MRTKALLLIVMLLGWAAGGWAADRVKGDGKLTTKKIEIEDFNEIKVDGVIDFNYVQSNATPMKCTPKRQKLFCELRGLH